MRDILELAPKTDLNVHTLQKKLEFDMVKKYLDARLSELDRKLLRLPARLQEKIGESFTDEFKIAYAHLRDCFYSYFSTSLDENIKQDIQWIDYGFAMDYGPAQLAMVNLGNSLFNDAAMNNVAEKLEKLGAFEKERQEFYFWNTEPENWAEISYPINPDLSIISSPGRKIWKTGWATLLGQHVPHYVMGVCRLNTPRLAILQ